MDYNTQIKDAYKITKEKWWNSESVANLTECSEVGLIQKKARQMRFDKCIDDIVHHIKNFPQDKEKQQKWKDKFQYQLNKILKDDYIFDLSIPQDLKEKCFKVTKQFFKRARQFDSKLSMQDIGQAMRNVWIVNMIQSLKGEEVCLTDAIFGYSMLYPYTDNLLDDVKISIEEKNKFNERLTKRLKGEKILPLYEYERKIFYLVECIENQFDRDKLSGVYESLLEIQQGQVLSLLQQDKQLIPYERDILGISIKKGGSSVLVDGFIVNGTLSKEEIEFCIGYGVLLQIADDIQDVKDDAQNNHITIMSQLAGRYDLDIIINKLLNFTVGVVDNFNENVENNKDYIDKVKKLIKDNCIMLILFSMALSKDYFSKEYIKKNECYLPFSIKYIENLQSNLEKKFSELKDMKESGMLDEIFDVLVE